MGNGKSKAKQDLRGKGQSPYGQFGMDGQDERQTDYEELELLLLRRAIKSSPELFVLNNLMMCVQFFKNYEQEISQIKESLVTSREAELNGNLPPHKHVLLPDVLQEHIAKNVGFTSSRQTFRPTIEPLQPVRMYTVYDNIDVTEQNYSAHYSSLNDSVMYNMLLKPTDHQGYVQLQLLEMSPMLNGNGEEDLSSIAEGDDDGIYSDGDSVYGPRPNSRILPNRPKQRGPGDPRAAKYELGRSLPNLYSDEDIYDDRNVCKAQSVRSIKLESDYPSLQTSASSTEERRSRTGRTEYRRYRGQMTKTQSQQAIDPYSRTSSTSSGYRSGNYAVDSDSSCNNNTGIPENSTGCNGYGTTKENKKEGRKLVNLAASKTNLTHPEREEYTLLPRRCFKKVTHTRDGRIYDPRKERGSLNSKQHRLNLALRRHNYELCYLSSTDFMKQFINLFVYRLADSLGFDNEAVDDAKREGCVIYCDKVMVSPNTGYSRLEQYEIIPAVWVQWPDCAQEWLNRPRSTWPNYRDLAKIKDYGCYVVPEGFVTKNTRNLIDDLEWQMTFPAAERYLETCMTEAQARVYLMSLMLHKTFLRPVFDTMFGLTTAHIRNQLFWMLEECDRPSKWPDNRTGESLLNLLRSLYKCISQSQPILPDYFVAEKNLFQRVPREHLLHTQKQLKRIIDNPVMYVFHAMENIQYNGKFFPRLDYEMFLRILTVDTLALINPALEQHIARPLPAAKGGQFGREEKYGVKAGFWDAVRTQKTPQKAAYYSRPTANRTLINPRKATDSIIEISIVCAELEGPRLAALLDFFIRHFIVMAECCHRYRAYRQKTVYLDQADRLSILLSEHQRQKDDARDYQERIKVLRKKYLPQREPSDAPETPRRNKEAPIFTAPLNERYRHESRVSETTSLTDFKEDSNSKQRGQPSQDVVTTKAMVHEVRFHEETNVIPEPKSNGNVNNETTATSVRSVTPDEEKKQVISIAETPNESFLTDTTYI